MKEKTAEKKKSFWKKHAGSLFLIALLIISIAWGFITNKISEKRCVEQTAQLQKNYRDSLQHFQNIETKKIVKTLSLAVRNGMINKNMQQVNQYLIQSVRNVKAERLLVVDQTTGEILISTDKKDKGKKFKYDKLVQVTKATILNEKVAGLYAATPIMGLNQQLGVLVLEMNKEDYLYSFFE